MNKLFLRTAIAAATFVSAAAAQAFTVDFQFVVPTDGSGKTSRFVGASNTNTSNVFVETFDVRAANGTVSGGINTPSSSVAVTKVSGDGMGYSIDRGSEANIHAAPAGDTTYYAYGPQKGAASSSAEVKLDYTGLLGQLNAGRPAGSTASLNYLGLYYGSIDTYNDLIFFNRAGNVITTVTGASLISRFNGISGNQSADSSNIYVNLFFTPSEEFTSFNFRTTGRAFEMDNLVVGFQVSQVPEPGSLALLGLGLAAVGIARRRKAS
jgi:hypothetical protein